MELLLSPVFISLSIFSLSVTGFHLWGLARASKRHNASPIGCLCKQGALFPNRTMVVGSAIYVLLTLAYFVIPVLLHH
jgi:hypothetical protein